MSKTIDVRKGRQGGIERGKAEVATILKGLGSVARTSAKNSLGWTAVLHVELSDPEIYSSH